MEATLAATALGGGAVASPAEEPLAMAARAAKAAAVAYAQDDGDGRPAGYVSVSGEGRRANTRRGTAVTTSTAGYKGSASASARVTGVKIFGGLVTADVASVRVSASGGASAKGGQVKNLAIGGAPQGSPGTRTTYDMAGYGKLVAIDDRGRGIVALKAHLSKAYGSYPAGSVTKVAYASPFARDGTPPPPQPRPGGARKPQPPQQGPRETAGPSQPSPP